MINTKLDRAKEVNYMMQSVDSAMDSEHSHTEFLTVPGRLVGWDSAADGPERRTAVQDVPQTGGVLLWLEVSS